MSIPTQLLQAYIYFVLALIQASVNTDLYQSHIEVFCTLLHTGMRAMLKSFSPASLLTYSSVLPTDILSLMSFRLLDDFTVPGRSINTVYSDWIKILENEIETKPAPSQQEKIQWLVAEINIIIEILQKQNNIFSDISRVATSNPRARIPAQSYAPAQSVVPGGSRLAPDQARTQARTRSRERHYRETRNSGLVPVHSVGRGRAPTYARAREDEESAYSADRYVQDDPDNGFQLPALDPGGFRVLLARDCGAIIEQRLGQFLQFAGKATALKQHSMHKTETRKDYQAQAVYAFTVVTIIFLPLSAISSIFGMNTSDIRELEQGQWLYWVTAVPVTVGVILIGLWWMGELGNATLWLLNQRAAVDAGHAE
ncbi:hypothetical protein F5Y10DRAFT_268419 [Nemania abortiva]|nr:hypothetical protein F5Y10DRAFT_268419 [Nemania abortiva]